MNLTAKRLRELLDYDPATGVLTWRCGKHCGKAAGSINGNGYVKIQADGHAYQAHRLAWLHVYGEWPAKDLDHINCNQVDNRITNLRLATRQENCSNIRPPKRNTSGIKGVTWSKRQLKWQAFITKNRHQSHLGFYKSKSDAAKARAEAAIRLQGEFARN